MDVHEYRKRGKEMVDYIADYLENIRDRRVFPDVKPGYMHNLLPESAPVDGEKWENIFGDIERVIMPGVTHWQSPHMHAYFPALNSFPSILGDMLADAINCLGFTWASSPACTELETIVMNWLGKMIGLPDEFLHLNSASKGGGVIQTTASESTLVCLLAGRTQAIKRFHEQTPGYQDAEINARLVAYCSDQAHSSVEKAALIGLVRMRYIESSEDLIMSGQPLKEAIVNDIKQGLIPFWVCCTLGTTGACAFDNLDEVGDVCREFGLWLHIDAAYAGSALICPEYRSWLKGIEKANSIAFNPSKWLMVHFDCTAMWVKDSTAVHRTFNVEPLYLQHENSGLAIDYMHWQIPLSKRFRSLKLWFVLRSFGIRGLQKHIREGVRLAQKFEALVLADHRFEIPAKRHLGMVVFRIKGENELTEKLLKRLNHRGKLHCVPASLKGKYIIRFTVTSTQTTIEDILEDWNEIKLVTSELLEEMNVKIDRVKVSLKDTKEKNEAFGSSLLLSNSPMSPKVVNGSFAAIFDADEFLAKTYAGIRIANPTLHTKLPPLRPILKRPTNFNNFQHHDSPSMRRRVRGILMSGKQFSLDSGMDLVVQSCYDSNIDQTEANAIREDIEDVLEVYESLGTPPMTPPPRVSPMVNRHTIQQNSQKLMETKVLFKPTAKSATQSNSIKLEILDPNQIPNKYRMVDNFKLSPSYLPAKSVRKPFHQAKKTPNDFQKRFFSFNNSFEDKFFSQFLKKSSSVENHCSNCNISLTESNKIKPMPAKKTINNINNENKGVHISGEPNENTENNSNFKSTVNTVIVKQNVNVRQNKKKLYPHSKSKIKSFGTASTIVSEEERYLINGKSIITNQITPPLNSNPILTANSQIYHGKKFLEQSSNDGIFAFYNIAFRTANSCQRHGSMSDISEEEIPLFDWKNVKSSINQQPSLTLSPPSTFDFNKPRLTNENQCSSSDIDVDEKSKNSVKVNFENINMNCNNYEKFKFNLKTEKEDENELSKPLAQSKDSLILTGLKIQISNEDERRVQNSFDSSIPFSHNDSENSVSDTPVNISATHDNKQKDENSIEIIISPVKSLCEYDKNEDRDNDSSNESENGKKNEKCFHDTTSESSTASSPTSGFSYPVSLWSSLEVAELISRSSSTLQFGADGWAVINDVGLNTEVDDICKKCGHNSIVTASNFIALSDKVNSKTEDGTDNIDNIYQAVDKTNYKTDCKDRYKQEGFTRKKMNENYYGNESDTEASA